MLHTTTLHSGEDKGRGTKQWTPREKEVFKVRQSHEKNLSYLIDFYVKKYFDGFDITTILPFTTIQRIFNNREVKKEIGLDIANESSFTSARMQLIIDASKWIVSEAEAADAAVKSIIYYSKKHYIQGQNKLIWEKIKDIGKLSKIIENYKRNLPNYITDTTMRQYFTNLFGNYEDNVDPLNWVVHRPAEFQLDSSTLVELPRKGLLTLINFLLS